MRNGILNAALRLWLVTVAAFCGSTTFAQAGDVIDDAYLLCGAMDQTGMTTECEVQGWGKSINVRIDTTGAEARKICAGVVEMMAQQTSNFQGEWTLKLFSPYSGDHPIATCKLK